ncbi:hypothetical protein BDV10DRAFT_187043 [Aspergillus recurvatus]
MSQQTKSCPKCKITKPLDDFRSRHKRNVAWCQPCRDIKNQAKRAAKWSKAAAQLTPEKTQQHLLQPGGDNGNSVSSTQPAVAQERATRQDTSASISDSTPLPTHQELRRALSATSSVRPDLTAANLSVDSRVASIPSPSHRGLQPKISTTTSSVDPRVRSAPSDFQPLRPGPFETVVFPLTPANAYSQPGFSAASSYVNLRARPALSDFQLLPPDPFKTDVFPSAPANAYEPIPMPVLDPFVVPTNPGLLDEPAFLAADAEIVHDFHDHHQSQAMQTCLQCQKPGFNMWLNPQGICAHCQEPNDISDNTPRDAEEPAKGLEPDDVPSHSTNGPHDPDVALPSTENDMFLEPDDVSSHNAQVPVDSEVAVPNSE